MRLLLFNTGVTSSGKEMSWVSTSKFWTSSLNAHKGLEFRQASICAKTMVNSSMLTSVFQELASDGALNFLQPVPINHPHWALKCHYIFNALVLQSTCVHIRFWSHGNSLVTSYLPQQSLYRYHCTNVKVLLFLLSFHGGLLRMLKCLNLIQVLSV